MNLHMSCTRTYVNSLKVNVNEVVNAIDTGYQRMFQFLKGKCDLRHSAASVLSISQRVRRSTGA